MSTDPTTQSVKKVAKVPKDTTTQRYLPFAEIRDNLILMKDGSSRMILRIHAVNFNLKSEEEQDSIIIGFQRFLNALRFPIQIIVRSLKVDIESYLTMLKNVALKQTNPLLQEQTYQYVNFLTNLIDLAQIMKKDFYIVVPFDHEEGASVRDRSFVGLFRGFWAAMSQEETVGSIREKRRKTESLRQGNLERLNIVKGNLEQIGIRSEEVTKDELVKLLIAYYNPRIGGDIRIKNDFRSVNIEK